MMIVQAAEVLHCARSRDLFTRQRCAPPAATARCTRSRAVAAQSLGAQHSALLQQGAFVLYWVTMGVLSSVGLGSGLHTFLLFTGPHIAQVANNAMMHKSVNFSAHIADYFTWPSSLSVDALATAFSPQYAEDAFAIQGYVAQPCALCCAPGSAADTKCARARVQAHCIVCRSVSENASVTFFDILWKVAPAAFLWGAGTAIGELPPYFIARAAAKVCHTSLPTMHGAHAVAKERAIPLAHSMYCA
ncbi:hypothetical protein EON66_00745 [archaeon]|nr:MAG: hypothetical protein EON66_00745 [archaeon]